MFRQRLRGLTAIEAIVTFALFAVVATLLVGVFTRSIRISTRESVNLELEQSCHFLTKKVEDDLSQSGISGISYLDTPQWHGVGINPIEDVTSEGTLAWQGTQILYFWDREAEALYKQNLTTSTSPLATPIRFTAEALLNLADGNPIEKATIGDQVKLFQVTNRRPDGKSRLIDVSVELERNLPNDETRRFRLDRLVTVLN